MGTSFRGGPIVDFRHESPLKLAGGAEARSATAQDVTAPFSRRKVSMDVKQVVDRFWALMASNDFARVGEVLADAFVLHWPQSGERIRGAANFAGMNQDYPAHGPWRFDVRRTLIDGDRAVTETFVTDGTITGTAITFFDVADERITAITEYWPDPFPAPAHRARWVEPAP
jgi:ketosteroid isomerase-like protein